MGNREGSSKVLERILLRRVYLVVCSSPCRQVGVSNRRKEEREKDMGETEEVVYPKMVISHSNTLSSSTNPAEKPSTGFFLSSMDVARTRVSWRAPL